MYINRYVIADSVAAVATNAWNTKNVTEHLAAIQTEIQIHMIYIHIIVYVGISMFELQILGDWHG